MEKRLAKPLEIQDGAQDLNHNTGGNANPEKEATRSLEDEKTLKNFKSAPRQLQELSCLVDFIQSDLSHLLDIKEEIKKGDLQELAFENL